MISNEPKRTLPHREPFLWVHRLMERNATGTQGVCEVDVSPEWDVFQGHFPGNPILPGVIQIEAAAQACLWIHKGVLPPGAPIPGVRFVAVDKYRFRRPVVPPMTMRISAHEREHRGKLFLWDIEVKDVEGNMLSSGAFWMQKLE